MDYNQRIKLLINDLLDENSQVRKMSISELERMIAWIKLDIRSGATPAHDKLLKSATDALELRSKYGYKNQDYNSSNIQTKIHDCANSIEKMRASLYRIRKFVPQANFDDSIELFDLMASQFSDVANDIREGHVPVNRNISKLYKKSI